MILSFDSFHSLLNLSKPVCSNMYLLLVIYYFVSNSNNNLYFNVVNNWNILYFSVIAGFRGAVPHGLSLEIGDTVQILEKCDGEFTGDSSDN